MFSLLHLSVLFLSCSEQAEDTDLESPLLSQETQYIRKAPLPKQNAPQMEVEEEDRSTPSTGLGTPLTFEIPSALQLTKDVATIRERVKYFSLRQSERVWDKIPWVTDYSTAQALSQESQRPIFLFSMWGELDGRC